MHGDGPFNHFLPTKCSLSLYSHSERPPLYSGWCSLIFLSFGEKVRSLGMYNSVNHHERPWLVKGRKTLVSPINLTCLLSVAIFKNILKTTSVPLCKFTLRTSFSPGSNPQLLGALKPSITLTNKIRPFAYAPSALPILLALRLRLHCKFQRCHLPIKFLDGIKIISTTMTWMTDVSN